MWEDAAWHYDDRLVKIYNHFQVFPSYKSNDKHYYCIRDAGEGWWQQKTSDGRGAHNLSWPAYREIIWFCCPQEWIRCVSRQVPPFIISTFIHNIWGVDGGTLSSNFNQDVIIWSLIGSLTLWESPYKFWNFMTDHRNYQPYLYCRSCIHGEGDNGTLRRTRHRPVGANELWVRRYQYEHWSGWWHNRSTTRAEAWAPLTPLRLLPPSNRISFPALLRGHGWSHYWTQLVHWTDWKTCPRSCPRAPVQKVQTPEVQSTGTSWRCDTELGMRSESSVPPRCRSYDRWVLNFMTIANVGFPSIIYFKLKNNFHRNSPKQYQIRAYLGRNLCNIFRPQMELKIRDFRYGGSLGINLGPCHFWFLIKA